MSSTFMRSTLLTGIFSVSLGFHGFWLWGAEARYVPNKGDRIALVGNALPDRMQHHHGLETLVYQQFPDQDLVIRNLGFAGDEVNVQIRSQDVPPLEFWLDHVDADVVFVFYGFNEALRGLDYLPEFREKLSQFLKGISEKQYNGKTAPKVVLFSPLSIESKHHASLKNPDQLKAQLREYTRAMKAVAEEHRLPFVDLFTLSEQLFAQSEVPLTINGFHLSKEGDAALAPKIFEAVFGKQAPAPSAITGSILQAVQDKSEVWESRYRTVDAFNIFGGRSRIAYNDITNAQVVQEELKVRDVMTANRDRKIWAVSQGKEHEVKDDNLPEVPSVPTNIPGKNPDGSHTFLSGEEAISRMKLPKGLQVSLFADEKRFPELVNPVQMAWDTKGRLWVSAWKNYPGRTPFDKDGDKILIFEDTDADGQADKVTTFMDNLNCPTGFQFYKDGVLIMKAPNLVYARDTDGDDRADHFEAVLMGLDSADSHHQTNAMCYDPAGSIYLSDGVFHRTQVETANGVVRNADGCIYKFNPRTFEFERYAPYGFANPHGRVFDSWGNDIITDATGNNNYFGPAMSGFLSQGKHPHLKDFWNRPSRPCPGTAFLSSRHFSEEFQNNFLNANVISIQGIFRVKVSQDGSGLKGETLEHLITSDDPNFRPSAMSVAPDGSLYFLDWHNPIIGHLQHHLRDPNRDHQHGRIYRITQDGRPLLKPEKISGQSIEALLELLRSPEDNVRERAKIELDTHDTAKVMAALDVWLGKLDPRAENYERLRLEGLWLKAWHHVLDLDLLKATLRSPHPQVRAAATRVLCYEIARVPEALELLKIQAGDEDPRVRLHAIRAASFFDPSDSANALKAVEVTLEALRHPTDYYLDYTAQETLRQLEPAWRKAIADGTPFAQDNDKGISYLLDRLNLDELRRMPKTPSVLRTFLTRPGIPELERLGALGNLATIQKRPSADILIEILKEPDAPTELARLLPRQAASDLKRLQSAIRSLPESMGSEKIAALIVGEGNLDAAWNEAQKNLGSMTTFLRAYPLIPDLNLRTTGHERLVSLVTQPSDTIAQALKGPGPLEGRYVRIEVPRRTTLTLAEVEVYRLGKNIAPQGTATQSSVSNGGEAKRAIDGNKNGSFSGGGQTHSRDPEDNPWWELDLGATGVIEGIGIWNRSEGGGQFASRLDGYHLKVLDAQRNVVFELKDQKAPIESVKHEVSGDSSGAYHRALISALTTTGKDPAGVFALLTQQVTKADQAVIPLLAEGILKLPRNQWKAEHASQAVKALVSWGEGIPSEERTTDEFIATMQATRELVATLPSNDQKIYEAKLNALKVNVFVVKTVHEQLRFDVNQLEVEAGKPFEIRFYNDDVMPHNFLVVAPDSHVEIGQLAQVMTPEPDAKGRQYVPQSPKVLAASKMIESGEFEILKLTAPKEPGDYEYVCTFPGHWMIMWGKLKVVPAP